MLLNKEKKSVQLFLFHLRKPRQAVLLVLVVIISNPRPQFHTESHIHDDAAHLTL